MESAPDHNSALQNVNHFTAADLEANKQGRYSESQLRRLESEREFFQQTSGRYENRSFLVSSIFGVGALFFCLVLYFVGVFEALQTMLGGLFLPVMAGLAILAVLFIFVIVPRQYQSSVEMYKSMGAPLAGKPPGAIQTIEARAKAYESRAGLDRNLHSVSSRVSYVLEMDGIKFLITESLMTVIQNNRLYRVYCINDGGVWRLLSMETLE